MKLLLPQGSTDFIGFTEVQSNMNKRFILIKKHKYVQQGATLVEFVIVFPLAVLFVLCLIQIGFMYMAKSTLNQATFMAARAGAMHNADETIIKEAMVRGLSPFYQDSTKTSDVARLGAAYLRAKVDANLPVVQRLVIDVMNPSAKSFSDFGIKDPAKKVTYIPNDNLEWRDAGIIGGTSRQNIRDANLLKIRTIYGYELKVPLIAGVLKRVMCGGNIGVEAWGNVSVFEAVDSPVSKNCLLYYSQGRVPIESFAIVEMQSRAEKR
jgi:TadE-like protein